MGAGDIGLPSLRALIARPDCRLAGVVTQPDRPAGRGNRLRAPQAKIVAADAGIPVLQPRKLRDPAAVEELRALAPDLVVVMAYGQILPRAVLEIPRLACINLHASLLPRHRGAAPIQAAIAQGDAETGITVMHMAEGLDTGDMILGRALTIAPDETGGSLHDRLAALAPTAMNEAIDLLLAGPAPRIPQSAALATYAGRLQREDGLIDWARPSEDIERRLRAFDPWPASFTTMPVEGGEPRRVKIFRAAIADAPPAAPGTVLAADLSGPLVATGDGALRLLEVQGEGSRRMSSADWLRGHPLRIGGRCA